MEKQVNLMNATQALAEFIQQPSPAIPQVVRRRAIRYLIDTVAVTLAGSADLAIDTLQTALPQEVSGVVLPWMTTPLREDDACLLLGTASHVLDYDDVCMLVVSHPSAPVLSALQVVARQKRMSGHEFITCFVLGVEVMIRCGEVLGFRHYDLGYHATGTLGIIGATAACARALDLSVEQTRNALAIAASQSSGLQKNFGSMVKPLHVGLAASHALKTVRLAKAGVCGADEVFEGRGWLNAFSGGETQRWPEHIRLGQPYAIEAPGFEQKRYPCCYMMHKIIRATLELRHTHGLSLNGLSSAQVIMPRGGTKPLIHPNPKTGLNGKFSGTYAVAAGLLDGRVLLGSFEDMAVLRSAIQAAIPLVTLTEQGEAAQAGSDVGSAPVTVSLRYQDGSHYTCTISKSPGSLEDPMTDAELLEKWVDCLSAGGLDLHDNDVRALFEQGLSLESSPDVSEWLALRPESIETLGNAPALVDS